MAPVFELLRDLAVMVEVLREEACDSGPGGSQAALDADRLAKLLRRVETTTGPITGPFPCPYGCGRDYPRVRDAERCLWNYDHTKVDDDARRF